MINLQFPPTYAEAHTIELQHCWQASFTLVNSAFSIITYWYSMISGLNMHVWERNEEGGAMPPSRIPEASEHQAGIKRKVFQRVVFLARPHFSWMGNEHSWSHDAAPTTLSFVLFPFHVIMN